MSSWLGTSDLQCVVFKAGSSCARHPYNMTAHRLQPLCGGAEVIVMLLGGARLIAHELYGASTDISSWEAPERSLITLHVSSPTLLCVRGKTALA